MPIIPILPFWQECSSHLQYLDSGVCSGISAGTSVLLESLHARGQSVSQLWAGHVVVIKWLVDMQRSFLGLGFLAGGYTAVMAAFYWAFDPMMNLMLENWEFVLGYVVIAGLVGFAIIYWWGGVSNPRTFDLIQWSMQLFALVLIFFSTPSNELSAGLVALNLFTYSIPIRQDHCLCSNFSPVSVLCAGSTLSCGPLCWWAGS